MALSSGSFPPEIGNRMDSMQNLELTKRSAKDKPILEKLNHSVTLLRSGAYSKEEGCRQLDNDIVELTQLIRQRKGSGERENQLYNGVKEQTMKIRDVVQFLARTQEAKGASQQSVDTNLDKLLQAIDDKMGPDDASLRESLENDLRTIEQESRNFPTQLGENVSETLNRLRGKDLSTLDIPTLARNLKAIREEVTEVYHGANKRIAGQLKKAFDANGKHIQEFEKRYGPIERAPQLAVEPMALPANEQQKISQLKKSIAQNLLSTIENAYQVPGKDRKPFLQDSLGKWWGSSSTDNQAVNKARNLKSNDVSSNELLKQAKDTLDVLKKGFKQHFGNSGEAELAKINTYSDLVKDLEKLEVQIRERREARVLLENGFADFGKSIQSLRGLISLNKIDPLIKEIQKHISKGEWDQLSTQIPLLKQRLEEECKKNRQDIPEPLQTGFRKIEAALPTILA